MDFVFTLFILFPTLVFLVYKILGLIFRETKNTNQKEISFDKKEKSIFDDNFQPFFDIEEDFVESKTENYYLDKDQSIIFAERCDVATKKEYTRKKAKSYIDLNGYRRFNDGSHKLVHRWVAEKKLGRKLRRREVVHHIDGNKLNNNPDNLYVCENQEEHQQIHERYLKTHRNWYGPQKAYGYHYSNF